MLKAWPAIVLWNCWYYWYANIELACMLSSWQRWCKRRIWPRHFLRNRPANLQFSFFYRCFDYWNALPVMRTNQSASSMTYYSNYSTWASIFARQLLLTKVKCRYMRCQGATTVCCNAYGHLRDTQFPVVFIVSDCSVTFYAGNDYIQNWQKCLIEDDQLRAWDSCIV